MNLPNALVRRATLRAHAVAIAVYSSPTFGCFLMLALAIALLSLPAKVYAQSAPGTIVGQVRNAATGANLNNARVAVKGTNIVALTDESGTYTLNGVPGGSVTLRVFFTGLDEQEVTLNVPAGETARKDVDLTSERLYGKQGDTVTLDVYNVQSTRETNAAAIAVNEQRVA